MYSYTFDQETGGIILNSTPTNFSKEPRPVYACEMDILGFDKYWHYSKQNETPYMWAEANTYWYRNVKIATIKGGDLYTAPDLVPARDELGEVLFGGSSGYELLPIDIAKMCEKNRVLMTVIEDATVKKIVKAYEKYKKKMDIFHVAFSGGKDSAVLLDLVKKALPKDSLLLFLVTQAWSFRILMMQLQSQRNSVTLKGFLFITPDLNLSRRKVGKSLARRLAHCAGAVVSIKARLRRLKCVRLREKTIIPGWISLVSDNKKVWQEVHTNTKTTVRSKRANIALIQFLSGLLPRCGCTST